MPRQRLGIDAAAGQIVGGLRHASHKQAGRQQQDAHRIHGVALQQIDDTQFTSVRPTPERYDTRMHLIAWTACLAKAWEAVFH
ncbi:hypothetical protein XHC_4071 [Xanthomonas hortorum pv. carotae str. M081]|nr:hypothetical protein XHC_4071 [Xanthomonas hortorum pv. carotae str. M081]